MPLETATSESRSPVAPLPAPKLFSGLRTVASSTLLSRVLGMIRDCATGNLFGLSPVADAFAFAFRIPNLARRLFGEGALSAAFLPIFARELERKPADGSQSAWQLASAVFALMSLVLVALVILGEAVLWLLGLQFADHADTQLLLGLTAVMLPYAVLICLAAQVTAVLHALGHFTWPALVPAVLNLCLLATIWLVDPIFEPDRVKQAYALAVCVVIAGVLQLGLQWPTLLRLGFRWNLNWSAAWPGVKEIFRSMLPITLGLSITQINTVLDSCLAWALSRPPGGAEMMSLPWSIPYPLEAGAVAALYYGERVYQFPLGVLGVALGTVLYPLLSRHAARGELTRLRDDLTLGLRLVVAIGIPASAGLMLVAHPLTRALFERGEFTTADASRTAALIAAYGMGVWAYCGIPVLYRAFYAVGERTLPVRVGLMAVVLDLVFNLTLIWPLAEQGLAYSTAISAAIQLFVLAWLIQRRIGPLEWNNLFATCWRATLSTAAMTVVCVAVMAWCPTGSSGLDKAVALLAPLGAGVLAYAFSAHLCGMKEIALLFKRDLEP